MSVTGVPRIQCMRDEREFRGRWWAAEQDPEDSIGGILSYKQTDRLELEVFDRLGDEDGAVFAGKKGDGQSSDRIYGVTEDGEAITLTGCQKTFEKVAYQSDIVRPESYLVETAVLGQHYEGEIRFDAVSLNLEAMYDWFSRSGLTLDFGMSDDDQDQESIMQAEYAYPDSETVVSRDLSIHFDPGITVSQERHGIEISERTTIEIEAAETDDLISLTRAQSVLQRVRLFVALGLQEPVQPVEVTGYERAPADEPPTTMQILSSRTAESTVSEKRHPQNALFLLPDLGDTFEPALDNWLQNFVELEPVFNLYFETIYNNPDRTTTYLLYRALLELYYQARISEAQSVNVRNEATAERSEDAKTTAQLIHDAAQTPFSEQLDAILARFAETIDELPSRLATPMSTLRTGDEQKPDTDNSSPKDSDYRCHTLGTLCDVVILSELGLRSDKISTLLEDFSG